MQSSVGGKYLKERDGEGECIGVKVIREQTKSGVGKEEGEEIGGKVNELNSSLLFQLLCRL